MKRSTVLTVGILICVFGSTAVVSGQNPPVSLHMAAATGDLKVIQQYIDKKADLNALDSFGYTPLKQAVSRDRVEVVNLLLSAGANPNVKDPDGMTVLLPASLGGQQEIVDALIAAKADLSVKNRSGETALHLAVQMGHFGVAESLLKAGADVNATTTGGQTALGMVQQRGNMPELEELLKKHGGTVPAVDPRLGPYGEGGASLMGTAPSSQVMPTLAIDPNEIRKDLARFPDVEASLKVIDANSESEQRAWVVRRSDNRTLLIRAVQKQFDQEMKLVKQLAVQEKAAKTTKAIDDLVAARKIRYEQINTQLREQRRQTLAENRETTTGAATRGRSTMTRSTRGRSTGGATGQDIYGTSTQQTRAPRRETTAQGAAEPAMSEQSQAQLQAWLNATTESKVALLGTTHELDIAEYTTVRDLAEEEKAEKTQTAVMALLMFRQERIAKIMAKWQEEDVRLQRMQERTGMDPSMQGTQQGTQQGTRRGGRR